MKHSEKIAKIREERNALYKKAHEYKDAGNETLYHDKMLIVKGMNLALSILDQK